MKAWNAGDYDEAIKQVNAGMNDRKNSGLRTRRLAEQALLKADPFLNSKSSASQFTDDGKQQKVEQWSDDWKERLQPSAKSKVLQKWNATGEKPQPESAQQYTLRRAKETAWKKPSGRKMLEMLPSAVDFIPGSGDVKQALDAAASGMRGNYTEAGLLGAGLLLPAFASKMLKPIRRYFKSVDNISDKKWDEMYYRAIKSGDTEEVQRLRDFHFVAKTRGNKAVRGDDMPLITYHTVQDQYDPNFTVFNPNIEGSNSAIYTSSDPLMSGTYANKIVSEYERDQLAELMRINELRNIEQGHVVGGSAQLRKTILQDPERGRDWIVRNTWLNQPIESTRQKQLYVNLQNPVLVDNGGRSWNNIDLSQLYDNYSDVYKSIRPHGLLGQGYSTRSLEAAQREAGIYDGAIIRNVADYGGSRKSSILDWSKGNDIYMVNSPNRVKLADPITYDDAGNIIPLSQRDNFSIGDIRYLLPYAMGGAAIYGAYGTQK